MEGELREMAEEITLQVVKLSQWNALLVESLRSLGWTDEEIIENIKSGVNLPKDGGAFRFNYEELLLLAEQEPAIFESAVLEGYQIKYNTVRGIRSWIRVAFGYEPKLVQEAGKEAVLTEMSTIQLKRLQEVLSFGWRIVPLDEPKIGDGIFGSYRIEPVDGMPGPP